jgi:short-subunit dehydrogenase
MMEGKVALVTGASRGLGTEIARQLHRSGARVVLVARSERALDRIADELNGARPESAVALAADLASQDIDRVERFIRSNGIDLLVNNAASTAFGRFDAIALEAQIALIRLNVEAPVRLAHAAVDVMRRRGGGAIVNIASVGAFRSMPFMATGMATKTFLLMHGLALRYELASFGIRVVNSCPGPLDTEGARETPIVGPLAGAPREDPSIAARRVLALLEADRAIGFPSLRAAFMSMSRLVPESLYAWSIGRLTAPHVPPVSGQRRDVYSVPPRSCSERNRHYS